MRVPTNRVFSAAGWQDQRSRLRFSFRALLWMMIFPQAGHRAGLTLSGVLLICLSMAVGMAAYNSANNILFLTLSLLLGCLVLSGILSWFNFRGLNWRLEVAPPMRVGQDHSVSVALRNSRRFLPCYGVRLEVELASQGKVQELPLRERLDPRTETRLDCTVRPAARGLDRVTLVQINSYFPFGFLRKTVPVALNKEVVVWPAAIEYRRFPADTWERSRAGATSRRPGYGGDLLALRRYEMSDSHRQIHWKASARLRKLMVRQESAEAGQSFSIWMDLSAERWTRPVQFELLCNLAATLAEDLFKAGKLRGSALGNGAMLPVRRWSDVEFFLDQIALAKPLVGDPVRGVNLSANRNLITFEPDGPRGVAAYVNGTKAAAA